MMMREVHRVGFGALLLLVVVAIGCQAPVARNTNGSVVVAQTRVVVDDLGRSVVMPVKIARAVSLAPSLTESIFAVGAGDRLVGVTTFCNYPAEARAIAKIGDTMAPNLETIVALKPDIVFVSTASQIEAFMRTLEDNGIAVYVSNPDSLADVMKDLERLGEMFGTAPEAGRLIEGLQKRIADLAQKLDGEKRVRVFVQISREPLFTIGRQSFMTAILEQAGAVSVTAEVPSAYPKLSKETALALSPEAVILSESDDNREPNEVFRNSPAVKAGRVISINADLLSRPGPRVIDAMEQVARELHPDKFR